MKVEIDEKSGFCFGVQNAVEIAEEALARGEKVYSLGHIVHNDLEVERLHSLGLEDIDHEKYKKLRDCKVLIRAHGEPPGTYKIAEQNNITIIEATCPIVKRLQSRISSVWAESLDSGAQVVIFGKEGHAEVIGLMGHTGNNAILTDGEKNLDLIDYSRPVSLFSQTTMNPSDYKQLAETLKIRIQEKGFTDPGSRLHVFNTICGQVSNRQPGIKQFAARHEVVVFVSGRDSSNGRMLFSVAKSVNPSTWFISSPSELKREWFTNIKTVGVCGATSTPKWLIEEVRDKILTFRI